MFSLTSALHEYRRPTKKEAKGQENVDFTAPFSFYLSGVGFAYEEIGHILRTLSYVGPLRERPRRHYEVAGEIPRSVGSRGENTANLLYRRFDSLHERLNKWIRRFEFGDGMNLESLSEDLFSLEFETGLSRRTNIADAGFGASQVLPLVVQALAARKGSLTIAEQPEIHLNPRLQCVLADLFVEMAKSDHRLVVETHSEHLLLRLRTLIASGEIEHDKVAIYFVERVGNRSKIRSIPMDKNGRIESMVWPEGFFEETLRESIALAQAQSSLCDKR